MPFIRYTRDKRGYEHTYVMHAYRPGQGPARARVLYLFRSPANLRIGRRALDPEVTEALEHTHPDLSFDWTAVVREPEVAQRPEARDRWRRPGPPQTQPNRPKPAPDRPPVPVVRNDDSPLGRTLGAEQAARLRGRYNDLLQRIARRSRTPEDRDRLTERARRLNPDEWPDEAAIRAGAGSVEAAWDAIAAELPQRHRGRRGGRNRGAGGRPVQAADQANGSSAIIMGDGNANGHSQNVDAPGQGRVAGADRDSRRVGSDAPGAEADAPAGERLPGGG